MTGPRKRSTRRRRGSLVVGLAFLSYLGYYAYSMRTGNERMTQVCGQIKAGMTLPELKRFSDEHGLSPNRLLDHAPPRAYFGEVRTMGRFACRVEFDGDTVRSATVNFAD